MSQSDSGPAAPRADVPRRNQMLSWVPAEKVIFDAVQVVEGMGADERLTDAVVLLGAARDRVADFVDGVTGKRTVPGPAQSHSSCPACGGPHFYGRGTAHFDGCKNWDALDRPVKPVSGPVAPAPPGNAARSLEIVRRIQEALPRSVTDGGHAPLYQTWEAAARIYDALRPYIDPPYSGAAPAPLDPRLSVDDRSTILAAKLGLEHHTGGHVCDCDCADCKTLAALEELLHRVTEPDNLNRRPAQANRTDLVSSESRPASDVGAHSRCVCTGFLHDPDCPEHSVQGSL
jgi:hypothetical protein